SGMLTIGYLIAVLSMIRVGEKLLQKTGARRPMLWGTAITGVGVALMAFTRLPDGVYVAAVLIGYILFGLGLGFYATPSTDTAISSAPEDKIGVASGIYKMASSLGGAFGIAISASAYAAMLPQGVAAAASVGLLVNVLFCVLAFLAIALMVPRQAKQA
ncbi:MAG: MFS transporter, partial [Mixta calida]|nr:MFS transporter [Mixta calida]